MGKIRYHYFQKKIIKILYDKLKKKTLLNVDFFLKKINFENNDILFYPFVALNHH